MKLIDLDKLRRDQLKDHPKIQFKSSFQQIQIQN